MKGVFKCAREDDKKIQECQTLKLGDSPTHPLLHQQLSVRLSFHYIFITSCVMCYAWSVLLLVSFLVFFSFACCHNELEPIFLCVGEKHAPLQPGTQHRIFMSIFAVCVLCLSIATVMFSS